jgi:hypothetical protein
MQNFKNILIGSIILSVILLIMLNLPKELDKDFKHKAEVLQMLSKLNKDSIDHVSVSSVIEDEDSSLQNARIIRDSIFIGKIVDSYKTLRPYSPGDGKLPGDASLTLTLILRDGREIKSTLYNNKFSTLIFIPTRFKEDIEGLDDLFSSNNLFDLVTK